MTGSLRVLVLDDDTLVRESIAAFLEDDGFSVASVSSAEDALVMLKSGDYDVCLTDQTLPGMNGDQLILLASDVCPATRFIMHSGLPFTPSDELLKTGFTPDDVMAKPIIHLELLSAKIKELANKKGASE